MRLGSAVACLVLAVGVGLVGGLETGRWLAERDMARAGFTDGELSLMRSQVAVAEGEGLLRISVRALGVAEVQGDRLAVFALSGFGTCRDGREYEFQQLAVVEHQGIFPDHVGPLSGASARAFAGIDGLGTCH